MSTSVLELSCNFRCSIFTFRKLQSVKRSCFSFKVINIQLIYVLRETHVTNIKRLKLGYTTYILH